MSTQKKKLSPVIGYVHDLSKVRQGPKRKWFEMKLQTATGKIRAVCFAKDKYNIFAEKEQTVSPVKITNYIASTLLDGLEEEILINDMCTIQTPASSQYNFQYEARAEENAITTLFVVYAEMDSGSFVNVKGKLRKGTTVETVRQNNAKMLKCAVTDHSAVLPITIWEDEIDGMLDGHVYEFHGVGVRYRDQTTYLTTTRNSRIIERNDEDLMHLNDSEAAGLLLPVPDTRVEVKSIRSVSVKLFRSCVECFSKIPTAFQMKIVKCLRCNSRMRFADCKVAAVAKAAVICRAGSTVNLTMFSEVIENFFGVQIHRKSVNDISELLLEAKNIVIMYNNQGVVTEIEHMAEQRE